MSITQRLNHDVDQADSGLCCDVVARRRGRSAAEKYTLHSFQEAAALRQVLLRRAQLRRLQSRRRDGRRLRPVLVRRAEVHRAARVSTRRSRSISPATRRTSSRSRTTSTTTAGPTSSSSAFPGKEAWWFDNPQGKPGHWERHVHLAGGRQRVADVYRPHGRRRPELVLQHRRPNSATPRFRKDDPTKPWKFHAIYAGPRLPAVHARHGRGRRERRRPARRAARKNGWWEQPAADCEGRVLEVSSGASFPTAAGRRCTPTTSTATATTTSSPARPPTPTACPGSRTSAGRQRRDQVQRTPHHGREARAERVRRRLLAVARARARRHGPRRRAGHHHRQALLGPCASTIPARSIRPCCIGSRRCATAARCGSFRIASTTNSGVGTQVVAGDVNGDKWPTSSSATRRARSSSFTRRRRSTKRRGKRRSRCPTKPRPPQPAEPSKAERKPTDGIRRHGGRWPRAEPRFRKGRSHGLDGDRQRVRRPADRGRHGPSASRPTASAATRASTGSAPTKRTATGRRARSLRRRFKVTHPVREFPGRRRRRRCAARRDRPRGHGRSGLHSQRPQRRRDAARGRRSAQAAWARRSSSASSTTAAPAGATSTSTTSASTTSSPKFDAPKRRAPSTAGRLSVRRPAGRGSGAGDDAARGLLGQAVLPPSPT